MVEKNAVDLRIRLLEYRKLQITFGLYNSIHRQSLMVGIVVYLISTTITFTYYLIGNFDELNVIMTVACALLSISNGMQVTVGFGYAGRVCSVSQSVNEKVDWIVRKNWRGRGSWAKKFWISCPTLKIQLFSTNFFDVATSLIFNQFCVDQTISLVLLQ